MELSRLRGVATPVRQKLARARIRSVEQLALVDLKRRRVPGVSQERLRALRKRAQLAIFEAAVGRVQSLTRSAMNSLEGTVSRATWATLDAAKMAQKRAQEAIAASGGSARLLAKVAASKARDAARVAQREYKSIAQSLKRAPPHQRDRLRKYEANARRAADAAVAASQHAETTLRQLQEKSSASVQTARRAGTSLIERLRQMAPHRFGRAS